MPEVETESAIHKVIKEPPQAVVKFLPPLMIIVGLLLVIVFRVFSLEDAIFDNSDDLMAAIMSLGLFAGGMWIILSKGYPPDSTKYAVGGILLAAFHYMSDTIEPVLQIMKGIFGGGG